VTSDFDSLHRLIGHYFSVIILGLILPFIGYFS